MAANGNPDTTERSESVEPLIEFPDPVEEMGRKFDFYIKVVISILVVAVLTLLFMVGGLMLEAWHFNTAAYREYSAKLDVQRALVEQNQQLMKSNQDAQAALDELLRSMRQEQRPRGR